MMTIPNDLTIRSRGLDLDTSPEAFGCLDECTADPLTHLEGARPPWTRR